LRTQYDDPKTIEERQWKSIQELVVHAYQTVPFYKQRFDETNVRPDTLRGWDDFRRIPPLTKADIRAAGDSLLSSSVDRSQLIVKKTSGSTGVSLVIRLTEDARQFKRACVLRSDEWSGWRLGERIAMLWGPSAYLENGWRGRLRNALLERCIGLNTLKMDEAALDQFLRALRRRPVSLIFGHAHSVFLLAEFARTAGFRDIRPKGIITTAMVLHEFQRRAIEDVFGCNVTNRYGCEEVSLIACECERHHGLHVNSDGVYLEIERDGEPASVGTPGSILVTDLVNRAMPLIRYQVGDVGAWAGRACPCGRGLPSLERLEGREADYVTTPAGELVSGISLTENFAVQVPGIAQLQIVQETIAQFRFRIVRGPDFGPASDARLKLLVEERFGPDVSFVTEFVDRIPQEPSGKYRFCISRVPNAFTERARENSNEVATSR
jgi:phenylacetate-CoA ligase